MTPDEARTMLAADYDGSLGSDYYNAAQALLAAHDAQRQRAEAAERRVAGLTKTLDETENTLRVEHGRAEAAERERDAAARQLVGLREAARPLVAWTHGFLERWFGAGADERLSALTHSLTVALADASDIAARVIAEAEERGRLAEKDRIDAEEDAATWEWERDQVAATATAVRERDALRAEVERLTAQVAQADAATNALDAEVARLTKERDEALAVLAEVRRAANDGVNAAHGPNTWVGAAVERRSDEFGRLVSMLTSPPADLAAAYTRRVRAEERLAVAEAADAAARGHDETAKAARQVDSAVGGERCEAAAYVMREFARMLRAEARRG